MNLEKFLQDNYGYDPTTKNELKSYIDDWRFWYKGYVQKFHDYYVYNGQSKIKQTRFHMNMAKEISEDWSDILWSEKCAISMKDDNSQKQFNELINELDIYNFINQAIEKSGALGTCGTVVGIYDIIQNEDGMYLDVSNAKTKIDLVDIDSIFPLTWNNKKVIECAFASVEYVSNQKYIVLSVHKKNSSGNYVIYNHLFKDTNDYLLEIKENDDVLKEFDTRNDIPLFSIFKPNLTNNLFDNSPFGIPHFANAIDNLKSVDIAFDSIKNELIDGRRRTFVRADMLNYGDGKERLTFDANDVTIYALPKDANKDDLIQHDSDNLRTDKQIDTLNTELNLLGDKVGFGENHYHFNGSTLTTATAVVSSNSKLFRRKKKLEIGYESSIYDMVKAICYASSAFGSYNINTDDMVIQFDDSIAEDKESESNRAIREQNAGIISKVEYRMKIFGETEEIARAKIEEIKKEEPKLNELFGRRSE